MSLKEKLENISKESGSKMPDEVKSKMKKQIEELKSTGIVENSVDVGGKMPEFELPNADGEMVSSSDLLKDGNLVLTFFRGVW
jgi:hypothetical protein